MVKKEQQTIKVKQISSTIRRPGYQSLYLKTLGLKRINHERDVLDNHANRCLINKIPHLVSIVEEGNK